MLCSPVPALQDSALGLEPERLAQSPSVASVIAGILNAEKIASLRTKLPHWHERRKSTRNTCFAHVVMNAANAVRTKPKTLKKVR